MATKELIKSITVGPGGVSSIEFTSIPQTGTDLVLVLSLRNSAGAVRTTLPIRFNSSTTGFTNQQVYGTGSVAGAGTGGRYVVSSDGDSATANTFSNAQVYIPNYTGATSKIFSIDSVLENNSAESQQDLFAGLWADTAAITSITIEGDGVTINQYSTASLYKITKGNGGATVA